MPLDVKQCIESLGYKCPISSDWYSKIESWGRWYHGTTAFHLYKTYNGTKFVQNRKFTLNMSKTMCEDRADILMNEHTDIVVDDQTAQKYLDDLFDREDFWTQANQLIEFVSWSGTGAFVVRQETDPVRGAQTHIDYVSALSIYPLAWKNNQITACAFVSAYVDQVAGTLLYVAVHAPNAEGVYVVNNSCFDSDGKRVALPAGVMESWVSGSVYPTFQIIKLGMLNNLMPNNPMGIAIYANAIDVLKALDNTFDSLANEFILGRKRIFVDSSIVNVDSASGEMVPIFDSNDTVFYGIPGIGADTATSLPIKESNMSLRVEQHVATIQMLLDVLSMKAGFGRGFYQFEAAQVTTATEVISTDSKMYRRVRKDEIPLENALRQLTKVLLLFGGFDPEQEISIKFDDSVIEDTNAIAMRSLQEYSQGVISLEQYNERVNSLRAKAAARVARQTRMQLQQNQPPVDTTQVDL